MPEFTPVESSNLDAVALEAGTMFVKFKTGSIYKYPDVSPETYEEVRTAESVGKAFHRLIRGLPFERVA